jgi:hypothetical protein
MHLPITIILTTVGEDSGPFDIYSDATGYTCPLLTGISKASLISGLELDNVPDNATSIRIQSTGACQNYIDIPITICPTPTPPPTPSPTPTATVGPTPTPTATSGPTPTPTATLNPADPTPTVTPTPTLTPTSTPTPTLTPTPTATDPPPPCIIFTNFAKAVSFPGTLTTSSLEIKINAKEASFAQTNTANGTMVVAPGCENSLLNYQIFLSGVYVNQTGSIRLTINASDSQIPSSYTVDVTKRGPGTTGSYLTIQKTGSYAVNFETDFGSVGGGFSYGVSSESYSRIYFNP